MHDSCLNCCQQAQWSLCRKSGTGLARQFNTQQRNRGTGNDQCPKTRRYLFQIKTGKCLPCTEEMTTPQNLPIVTVNRQGFGFIPNGINGDVSVPGATSPYTNAPSGSQKYFRLLLR